MNELTEDEAKTKWCPFVRYIHHNGQATYNREIMLTDHVPKTCRCIASQCMMWQWTDLKISPKLGYCGLPKHILR